MSKKDTSKKLLVSFLTNSNFFAFFLKKIIVEIAKNYLMKVGSCNDFVVYGIWDISRGCIG